MIEILSLPKRHNINVVPLKNLQTKSGLPINSLPGWENIPLNSKLPMLKCPGNQVIFSKNKIGKSFNHLKQEFDPSGRDSLPEYNPLHDSNLRTFYSNERNLKRLRQNGEITQENDVICNLKDFNEYRQQLHKSQLYHILQALNRMEAEQQDRMLIHNAESITNRDHSNLSARQHSYTEILQRKKKIDAQREQRYRKLLQRTQEKFERIAGRAEMQKVLIEHRKTLHNLKMQQHWDVCNDLERKQLINLKKLFQFKKERLQKNLRLLKERREKKVEGWQIESWEKRLSERIAAQARVKKLLDEMAERRMMFIENHRTKYREKWAKIQDEIYRRSKRMRRKQPKKKKKKPKKKKLLEKAERMRPSFCSAQESFEKLMDDEMCDALNAALDMDSDMKIPFNPDDPIYKAAKFIKLHIIAKFNKDLSEDKQTVKIVSERIEKFLEDAKKFVIFRATQIISSSRDQHVKGFHDDDFVRMESMRRCMCPCVSFNNLSSTIGTSSYEIHPFIDVRTVNDRTPTPAGSLASIVVQSRDSLITKTKTEHLCRNELIFIEHFVIKFKRELIVGVGKRVFAAIRCHFEGKIMDVRQELLGINRNFLVNQATIAILSYAKNPLNFNSMLKFCISVLASEIVWSLQKHLLRPVRDPRGIVKPSACSNCTENDGRLCLFCHYP